MLSSIILCVLVFGHMVMAQNTNGPIVNLDVGTVQGMYETVTRGTDQFSVKSYIGIPYAQPPIGDHRFKKPEPVMRLDESPYDATYYRAVCPQMQAFLASTGTEDEDCLYLNVFEPEGAMDSPNGYAVMIWVHGGGFAIGSSNEYHGAYLAATGNVIVVTINYRLGLLGFLNTNDGNLGGNYGLYDQHMAFQWVHDNIRNFNGDNSRVTIFGESAGAMSVTYQGLYEKNHGLFQRIIAESGSVFIPMIDADKDTSAGLQYLADNMGCSGMPVSDVVECFRRLPWQTIKDKYIELSSDPANAVDIEFTVVTDGDIIRENPQYYLKESNSGYIPEPVRFFKSLDFLTGANQYEGSLFLMFFFGSNQILPTYEEMATSHVPTMMYVNFRQMTSYAVNNAVLHEYTNWTMPYLPESVRLELVKALGDISFVAPAAQNAMLNLDDGKQSRTYAYHFMPATTPRTPFTGDWLPGADHGEELMFLFPGAMSEESWSGNFPTAWERTLSDRMVVYWSNFAKTGNPNTPVTPVVTWPAYSKTNQSYLELDKEMGQHSQKHYFAARPTHFWGHVVPGLMTMEEKAGNDCDVSGSSSVLVNMAVLLTSLCVGYFSMYL